MPSRPPVVSRPGQGYEGEGGVLALRRASASRRLPTRVAALGSRAPNGMVAAHHLIAPPCVRLQGVSPSCPEGRASLTPPLRTQLTTGEARDSEPHAISRASLPDWPHVAF